MPKKEKLPPGWLKRESKSYPGKFYYFHKATARTTWLLPTDEEPFEIRKTKSKEPTCTNPDDGRKSPAKTSRKSSLGVKEKQESMVPRSVRQASTPTPPVSKPKKKVLNIAVLNRNNCGLVADYSSCSDGEGESSRAKKNKRKNENEKKKTAAILPAITERNKVQMKWKPVGPKIPQPSSKLVPKDEPRSKAKDTISPPPLKKDTKSTKKTVKSKKSSQELKKVTPPSSSVESRVSDNSRLQVPQIKKTAKKDSNNKVKTTKNLSVNLAKEKPVTSEKSAESKSSTKKPKVKRAGKKKSGAALKSQNLKKSLEVLKQTPCSDVAPVPSERFLPFQSLAPPEINNSYSVPIFQENDTSFSNRNISASSSFHFCDSYLLGLEDSSQPMEVDPDSDMIELIVQLRRDMTNEGFNTATGDLTRNFEMDTSNSIDLTTEPQVAYVVLDTNTLLNPGGLNVMKNICDGKYTAEGNLPYIIIPWVVMQELDVLKSRSKPKLAETAQRAIVFLSSYFTKKHPRVIGQTLKEAMQMREYLPAENNDDKILQCCMQLESKYPDCKVVLYSNDVNLRNKTLINGIAAFNSASIHSGLSNLSGITADDCDQKRRESYTPKRESYPQKRRESYPQEPIKEISSSCREINENNHIKSPPTKVATPQITLTNQISDRLKDILKGVLGLVLETEMKEAFNEIWLKIIKVQPPWELKDILYCIVEHWYAVFGQIYKNRKLMETKYRNLSESFSSKKGFADKSDRLSSQLDESLFVLEPLFKKNPHYKDDVKGSLESIEVLKQINAAIATGEVNVNSNLDQLLKQKSHTEEPLPNKTCLASHVAPESSFNTDFAMSIALTKFQKVWVILDTYCQEVERTLQNGASSETCQQVFATLQTSIPMMEMTYNQFSSCLGFSAADILQEVNMFTVLSEQLNAILPHLGCQDNDPLVNYIHLQTLFSNPEKREMLTNGLTQLEIMIRGLHTYQGHLVGT